MGPKRGFILIIVTGLLGSLAAVTVGFVQSSGMQKSLSRNGLERTENHLLLRSGVELGRSMIMSSLSGQTGRPELPLAYRMVDNPLPLGRTHALEISARDQNGSLDLSDGMLAGRMELGRDYVANALDPADPDPARALSARINLRIRRLLNAYGDAWRFRVEQGIPSWNPAQYGANPGNYGVPFMPTANDAADRDASCPAGPGFGDAILSVRPALGFRSLEEVRKIVNDWGGLWITSVDADCLGGLTFFDRVSQDLTLHAAVDADLLRMKRDFGVLNNDFTDPAVALRALDQFPPDLDPETLWAPHAACRINLNLASDEVKAAVFWSLVNVEYVAEGVLSEVYIHGDGMAPTQTNHAPRPTLGVAGPVFLIQQENGVPTLTEGNRFMSLRDAWCLARSYSAYVSESPDGAPDGFKEFADLLTAVREDVTEPWGKVAYEKLDSWTASNSFAHRRPDGLYFHSGQGRPVAFNQEAVERTLPRVMSGARQLPGWMQAPRALMNPYLQMGTGNGFGNVEENAHVDPDEALRSVEDFVRRMHLPQVTFTSGGNWRLDITARIEGSARRDLRVDLGVFETKKLVSQLDMRLFTDGTSDVDVTTGPEVVGAGAAASDLLGVAGLSDAVDPAGDTGVPYGAWLPFTDSLQADGGGDQVFSPEVPALDPFLETSSEAIVESVPAPMTDYPDFTANFSPQRLALFRNPPPAGQTWRTPGDALPLLNAAFATWPMTPQVPGGPWNFPLNENQMQQFMSRLWNLLAMHGMPPTQHLAPTADGMLWSLLGQSAHPRLGTVSVGFEDWFRFQPPTWPEPVAGSQLDHGYLASSRLEGPGVSLFAGGDLSPFGGISLSSRGHGPRAETPFSDSLYWRPTRLLGDPDPGEACTVRPGAVFNQGVISLWYRVPSGFWHNHRRSLFHMTLFESVEELVEDSPSFVPQTEWRQRPFHLSADIDFGRVLGHVIQMTNGPAAPALSDLGGTDSFPVPSWSGDVLLPSIPFPASEHAFPTDFLGVHHGDFKFTPTGDTDSSPYFQPDQYWRRFQSHVWRPAVNGIFQRPRVIVSGGEEDQPTMVPGSWVRLMVQWNLADLSSGITHNSRGLDGALRSREICKSATVSGLPSVANGYFHPLDKFLDGNLTFIDQMILTVGERALSHYGGAIKTTDPSIAPLADRAVFPYGRLDSLIDDLDIRFGPALAPGVPFTASRYDVRLDREPRWVVDPALPAGSKLIQVGATIADIIDKKTMSGRAHPWINVTVEGSNLSVEIARTEPGTVAPFRSPDRVHLEPMSVDESTRIVLTYRATDPSGAPYLAPRLSDIPWIESVSWSWIEGPARILAWTQW